MEIHISDFSSGKNERIEAYRLSLKRLKTNQENSKVDDGIYFNKIPIAEMARMQYGHDQGIKGRLQQYFLENTASSLNIRLFNFTIKVISCILYCVRVIQDSGDLPEHIKIEKTNEINYEYLIWVDTGDFLWLIQTIVAIISIGETILIFYLTYKGSLLRLCFNVPFLLELITSFPLILTIFVKEWRQFYVPIFLNCWLANGILEDILHDLHRVSQVNTTALSRQMTGLFSTLFCLIFSGACGIEHLQRSGIRRFNLFQGFYFVMVTFSTVGFGDFYPDWWMSQLYVCILIGVAFGVLPSKVSLFLFVIEKY
uniref:Potassium channel domain-containing protein n=1 Tax=Panagrolaimus sp. PS1159 TaxID=55785 RepID=A0AC35GHA1_9BILA